MEAAAATPTAIDIARSAKPKRPLSAFNLFYRYKRNKVLAAIAQGRSEKEAITRLVETAPGLEDCPPRQDCSPREIYELRRRNILGDLKHNLLPRDTRDRTHRTNQKAMNGSMSFLELGKLMNSCWKDCDEFSKSVFNELSEEGRERYRQRLQEYNDSTEGLSLKVSKAGTVSSVTQCGKPSSKKKRTANFDLKPCDNVVSDDGSATTETAEVRRVPPRKRHLFRENDILASTNPYFVASGDNESKNVGGGSQVARLATSVPNDYIVPLSQPPPNNSCQHDADTNSLMLRVRELEGQLATERLQERVRELEGLLRRQRTVEDQLRARIEAFSYSSHIRLASHPQEGLWSLANASMIHPIMQASERVEVLPRLVTTGFQQQHYAMSIPPLPHEMSQSVQATIADGRNISSRKMPPARSNVATNFEHT